MKGLVLVQVVYNYLHVSVFAIDHCGYLDPKIISESVIPCALHVKKKNINKNLSSLGAVPPDSLGKGPALTLNLLILLQLNAILRDHCYRVLIGTSCIAVEQNLQALLQGLNGIFLADLFEGGTLGELAAQDRNRKMSTKACSQMRSRECCSEQICGAKEGLSFRIETRDKDVVPQRVELGASFVENLGEVGVQVLSVEHVAVRRVVLLDIHGVEETVEILHVGNVTAKANHCLIAEFTQTLHVGETSQGSVGGYISTNHIMSDGNAAKEMERDNGTAYPGCR